MELQSKIAVIKKILSIAFPDDEPHELSVKAANLLDKNFYYSMIFHHKFAQSLWGNDFESHLVKMVRLKEPLEYLEKYFNDHCACKMVH